LYEWIYFAGVVVVVAAAAEVPFWWRSLIKPIGYAEGEFWTYVEPMMISKGVQADMTDAFDVNITVAENPSPDLRGLFFHVVSDSTSDYGTASSISVATDQCRKQGRIREQRNLRGYWK
jgi:hypothetical protein